MRITQLLGLVLLTGFLPGCLAWYTTVDDPPEVFSNHDSLESLIGQKSESVFRKLGFPNESLLDGGKLFMVYSVRSASIRHEVFLNNYYRGKGEILYCIRIELDSNDFVVKYSWVKSITSHPKKSCRNVFWSKEELTNLQLRTAQEVLLQQAEQGNAEAQLALFKNLQVKNPNEALVWLRRSADSGDQEARSILAKIMVIPSAWREVISQEGIEGLAKEEAERLAVEEALKRKNILSLRDSLGKYMTTSELEQLSIEGNPYAQFRLYTELMGPELTIAYRWLCKSADNGHPRARYTLGQIFHYSNQGHVQAYVWYSLSSYSQSGRFNEVSLQSFVDKNLSAEEYQKARIALLEWRPGQCERDLGVVSYIEQ